MRNGFLFDGLHRVRRIILCWMGTLSQYEVELCHIVLPCHITTNEVVTEIARVVVLLSCLITNIHLWKKGGDSDKRGEKGEKDELYAVRKIMECNNKERERGMANHKRFPPSSDNRGFKSPSLSIYIYMRSVS